MTPRTELAAARVSGSESGTRACWSASSRRPCWTSSAAFWRASRESAQTPDATSRSAHTTGARTPRRNQRVVFTSWDGDHLFGLYLLAHLLIKECRHGSALLKK